jgi:competence protein ComEC
MFVAFLRRAPFVRMIFPLAIGIALELYAPLLPEVCWAVCCGCIPVLWLLSRLPLWARFTYGWISGVILCVLITGAGSLLAHYSDIRYDQHYFARSLEETDVLLVTVNEPLQEKARFYRTMVQVTGIIRREKILKAKGRLLLYIEKDAAVTTLKCGDDLLLDNKLMAVKSNGNPGTFDYRKYCAQQQIYYQAYLKTGEWQLRKGNNSSLLLSARNYCLQTINKHIGGREAGLAAALLIGYRYDLDREMIQDYTNTGIMHIIAISGMHLALIYNSLLWLFQWGPSHRLANVIKATCIISLLWSFTLLTGAAASVLRATVMFTFITLGKFILDRHTNSYNMLGASAFLLLCYDPHLLTDAGFQLSYLSVLSILISFGPLYYLLDMRSWLMDQIWKALCLTVAAQILTLPVSLYYFQKFPVYSLPANLLAVPLTSIVLYGEFVLLLLGPFDMPAHFTGLSLKWLMDWTNTCIAWIGHLPGALITNIQLSFAGTICCYAMVTGMLIWLLGKWPKGLIIALSCGLLLSVGNMVDSWRVQRQHKLIVYNIWAHTAVDVINGRSVLFFADTLYNAQLLPARATFSIIRSKRTNSHCLMVGNKRLLVVDSALAGIPAGKKIRIDYLLLSHNAQVDIKQLNALFTIGLIIFDASNTAKCIQQWKSDCYELTLRFFSVPDQGAYVVNF